ncbi:MAG: hypothetical protein WBQ21_13435 [Solirubrobacteraceae bacterium]
MKPITLFPLSTHSVWDWEPIPDVPWGEGGIDDWGWIAQAPSSSRDAQLDSSTTTPPKEAIPHV